MKPLGTHTGHIDAEALIQRLCIKGKRWERQQSALRALEAILDGVELGYINASDRKRLINVCGWPTGRIEISGGKIVVWCGRQWAEFWMWDALVYLAKYRQQGKLGI